MKGVAIAAGDVAAVEVAAELNLDAASFDAQICPPPLELVDLWRLFGGVESVIAE
jgi:hypothetical protein|eukprot:COSAG06_NODE_4185_length_4494_cov_31.643231_6_plen_55_part_00